MSKDVKEITDDMKDSKYRYDENGKSRDNKDNENDDDRDERRHRKKEKKVSELFWRFTLKFCRVKSVVEMIPEIVSIAGNITMMI